MEKKYQVFISSTYEDLKEERKKVQEILLKADCIPAGMEAFVATNNEQFDVIKKVIDLCDYYVLIIGGRYGSINENTGVSYTEMEYDYAVSKGIPVLAFIIDDSVVLGPEKTDNDANKKAKLENFKAKVKTNRLVDFWKETADIEKLVALSITKARDEIDRPGWVRGGKFDTKDLLEDLHASKAQIDTLNALNATLKNEIEALSLNPAEEEFWDKVITIEYEKYVTTEKKIGFLGLKRKIGQYEKRYFCKTWGEVYQFIAPYFYSTSYSSDIYNAIKDMIGEGYNVSLESGASKRLKHQMIALGYVKVTYKTVASHTTEYLQVTAKGMTALNKLLLR